MVPSSIIKMTEMPLSQNGKVNRKVLRSLSAGDDVASGRKMLPVTRLEKKLAVIWNDVLKKEIDDIDADFFRLGGHSLKLVQLLNHVYREWGLKVKISDFFSQTSIRQQASLIAGRETGQYAEIRVIPEGSSYRLSAGQRRLWIISQVTETSRAYHLSSRIELTGRHSHTHLEKAILEVIRKHEILRTVFRKNEQGEIRQVILPVESLPFNVAFDDHGSSPSATDAFISAKAAESFSMEEGPLLRAGLIRLSDDRFIFHYTMHHIISDRWSMQILSREVISCYQALMRGETPSLLPLRIQYKDFAAWQSEQASADRMAACREYWLNRMAAPLPIMQISHDKGRPKRKTYNGYALATSLSASATQSLNTWCADRNGSLFMGVVTNLIALFYRYSGETDIVIGFPVAGRDDQALEDQIGFYINTLALRTKFSGEDSFETLYENIRRSTLEALENQAYPFDELIDDLQLTQDLSRSPLFDIFVNFENDLSAGDSSGSLPIEGIADIGPVPCKFDLIFNFIEKNGHLNLEVEYNTDIFNGATVARMIGHFKNLLASSLSAPHVPIPALDYLSDNERWQLTTGFNATENQVRQQTLIHLLEQQTERSPWDTAVVYGSTDLTFRELEDRSNRAARYLRQWGVKRRMLVPICMDPSAEMLVWLLGVVKCGGVYVPVDPQYPPGRIAYMLKDCGARLLITHSRFREKAEEWTAADKLYTDEVGKQLERQPGGRLDVELSPEDLVYVIYTSGSTGNPKGVAVTHGNLYNYLQWVRSRYLIPPVKGNFGLFTSLSFDLTVTSLFGPLVAGGCLHIYPAGMPVHEILRAYFSNDTGLDIIKLTPAHIQLLHSLNITATAIKRVIVGGDELLQEHIMTIKRIDSSIEVINEYGPTETTVGCTTAVVDESTDVISIGKPIDNTCIYILDAALAPVPVGVPGEIFIGGAQVAAGYFGNEALTQSRFIDDPFRPGQKIYRSGDTGRWLEDGNIVYGGRQDDQVKINGYRIELAEIELAIRSHPAIRESVVIARKNMSGGRDLTGFYIAAGDLSPAELQGYLPDRLPFYMVPQQLIQLSEIPLTQNGKIDRKKLAGMAGEDAVTEPEFITPVSLQEKNVAAIWKEVLKLDIDLSLNAHLFRLGGNSITALQILSRIYKDYGIMLSVDKVFQDPTVAGMAAQIEAAKWGNVQASGHQANEYVAIKV